jgi:hypothetical protein
MLLHRPRPSNSHLPVGSYQWNDESCALACRVPPEVSQHPAEVFAARVAVERSVLAFIRAAASVPFSPQGTLWGLSEAEAA